MKIPPPTPTNNVEVSLHTLTTLFKGVRGECLIRTCLFDPIYFGQDCRFTTSWENSIHGNEVKGEIRITQESLQDFRDKLNGGKIIKGINI